MDKFFITALIITPSSFISLPQRRQNLNKDKIETRKK
jgi:hypothetical protein